MWAKVDGREEIIKRDGFNRESLAFMGDDMPELEGMRAVGIPVCPADAASEVIEAARYVSEFGGGKGCVRDIIEQALRAKGAWARHLKDGNVVSA